MPKEAASRRQCASSAPRQVESAHRRQPPRVTSLGSDTLGWTMALAFSDALFCRHHAEIKEAPLLPFRHVNMRKERPKAWRSWAQDGGSCHKASSRLSRDTATQGNPVQLFPSLFLDPERAHLLLCQPFPPYFLRYLLLASKTGTCQRRHG